MGQRSQIYVRVNQEDGRKYLVPRYYGWNYGEQMVSRARGILDYLKRTNPEYIYSWDKDKFLRIMDVNFDKRDIVVGCDLINEFLSNYPDDFRAVFVGQDNNDGQFYLDVNIDYKNGNLYDHPTKYKYAFLPHSGSGKIMSPYEYMEYESEGMIDHWTKCNPSAVAYTQINMSYICDNAELMNQDELDEFINHDYVTDMNLEPFPFN